MRVSLVLLTRNEIHGVREIVPRLPLDAVDEVFAVDGGSTDGTVEYFLEHGVTIVPQVSKGRGEAFRLAFEHATGDALLFFSPDGNEDPADIHRFSAFLDQGYDMVIATRMVRGARNEEDGQWLPLRKWANNAFNLLANAVWNRGHWISDSINGYRAITKSAWRRLALDGPGYTIEYQSSIRAMKLGLRVAEFPTSEGQRIGPGGSPSLTLGVAFLKLFFRELRLGRNYTSKVKP